MADDGALKSDSILIEQQRRWHAGDHVRVEALLSDVDTQALGPEAVLDVIYSEVLLREDLLQENLTVDAMEQEYLNRFPEFSKLVARQFQVHRALQCADPYDAKGDTGPDTAVTMPPRRRESDHKAKDSQTSPQAVQIPGFQLLEVAGKGGSGIAYRALDEKLNRIVAVKLLIGPDARDKRSSRQLLREAEAAASLVHPMIVQIYQVGEAGGSPFLVMEYIDGGTLAKSLLAGPLQITSAVDTVQRIAEAVQYAHENGIIHRDLKPGNVLLDSEGQPHVCDFGLARRLDAEHTLHATGDVLGTPAYMPPEQARGEAANARSDVYALGAILYELLSGRPPFQAATPWEILHQVMTSDAAPLRQLNSSLPKDLETICERCLEKDPARRYESAREVADELARFRSGQPIHARPVGRLQRLSKWCQRNPAIAVLTTMVALALLITVVISLASQQRVTAALGDTQQALAKAKEQRDLALSAMNDLVNRVHDDLTKRGATLEARGDVLDSAIDGLQRIIDEGGDTEETRRTLAQGHSKRAYIHSQLAEHVQAVEHHRLALETAAKFTTADGMRDRAQLMLNAARFHLRVAEFDKAREKLEETIQYTESLQQDDPQQVEIRNVLAESKARLAMCVEMKEGMQAALVLRMEAHDICEKLQDDWPEDDKEAIEQDFVNLKYEVASNLQRMGQSSNASVFLNEALELLADRSPETSENAQIRRLYDSILGELATTQFVRMKYEDAYATVSKAIAGHQIVLESEIGRPGPQLRAGTLHEKAAACMKALGRIDKAKEHTQKRIDHFRTGLEIGGSAYDPQRYAIALGLIAMSEIHAREEEYEAATAAWQSAVDVVEPIVEQYQAHDDWNAMKHMTQLFASLTDRESTAPTADIQTFKLAMNLVQDAANGSMESFEKHEQDLVAALDTVESSVTRQQVQSMLAILYGLQHRSVQATDPDNAVKSEDVANKCISAIRTAQELGASPLLQIEYPEFDTVRQTDAFKAAFPVP